MSDNLNEQAGGSVRRAFAPLVVAGAMVRWADGHFDPIRRTIRTDDGRGIPLTPIESDLFLLLVTRAGNVVTLDEMSRHVWNHAELATTGVYQQAIRSLRAKLKQLPTAVEIECLRNIGYRVRFNGPG